MTIRNMSNHKSQKVSTKDYAYTVIKERIIVGELTPDEPIVEEGLASELEISRTPLREALQRLEIEELVVRQMNGRLKVASLSIKEVKEIFTIRAMLEEIVVIEATVKATERDISNLRHIVLMIEETFKTGNIDDILFYGSKFHTTIYELSDNKTANKILHQLNDHIHRYQRLIPIQNVDRLKRSITEHQQILEFMIKKDAESASSTMKEHIHNSLDSVLQAFKKVNVD